MKRLAAMLVVILLFLSITPNVLAAQEATKEDYLSVYQNYKSYYANVYVVAYHAYNENLATLRETIRNSNFTTEVQIESVTGFLTNIKHSKAEFFGDRESIGASRYLVPALRESISSAAETKDYGAMIDLTGQLLAAIELRVSFLAELTAQIDFFIDNTLPNLLQDESVSLLQSNINSVYQYILSIYQNYDIDHMYQRSDDSGSGDPALQTYLSRFLETSYESEAGYGNNSFGLTNPYSDKTGIVNWDSYKLSSFYTKQAVFISNNKDLVYNNSINNTQAKNSLQGTIIIYMQNGYNSIEIYYIDEDGYKSDTHYSIYVG